MSVAALIDVGVFQANLRRLADLIAPVPVMAMLKADAYAHGMRELAWPAIDAGAAELGVLEISAGLALRDDGIRVPLFAWLHGTGADFDAAAERHIDVGISTIHELETAAATIGVEPLVVHLKLDTGLHRNGAAVEVWPDLVRRAVELERVGRVRIRGVWSHLADASTEDDAVALGVFRQGLETARALGARPTLRHLAASSAGIYLPDARFDLVRFGIAAYGISPFEDRTAAELDLVPVMTLSTTVSTAEGGRARIAAGWADGIHPPAAGLAEVLVRGRRRRVVEVGACETVIADAGDLAPGDEVTIFGAGDDGAPTPADWAAWAGTIGDEIVTRIAPHVPRRYVTAAR